MAHACRQLDTGQVLAPQGWLEIPAAREGGEPGFPLHEWPPGWGAAPPGPCLAPTFFSTLALYRLATLALRNVSCSSSTALAWRSSLRAAMGLTCQA